MDKLNIKLPAFDLGLTIRACAWYAMSYANTRCELTMIVKAIAFEIHQKLRKKQVDHQAEYQVKFTEAQSRVLRIVMSEYAEWGASEDSTPVGAMGAIPIQSALRQIAGELDQKLLT